MIEHRALNLIEIIHYSHANGGSCVLVWCDGHRTMLPLQQHIAGIVTRFGLGGAEVLEPVETTMEFSL